MVIAVTERPEVRDNRIGIDTGAYATGRLTCLVAGRRIQALSRHLTPPCGAGMALASAAERSTAG